MEIMSLPPQGDTCPLCGNRAGGPNCPCCRLWRGPVNVKGYGQLTLACSDGVRRRVLLHRWVVEMTYALRPWPGGLVTMHLCDRRTCFRVEHLTLGTNRDNLVDAIRKGRATPLTLYKPDDEPCPQGHTGDFYRYVDRNGKPHRDCRQCNRDQKARRRNRTTSPAREANR